MEISYSQIVKNSFISLASGAAIGALLSDSWEGAAVGAIANLSIVEEQQVSTHARAIALFAAARLGCELLHAPKELVPVIGLALNAITEKATLLKISLTTACLFLHIDNYVQDLGEIIFCGKIVTEIARLWAHSPRALDFDAKLLFLPIGILCHSTFSFTAHLVNHLWQHQFAILAMYGGFREIQQSYLFPSRVADSLNHLSQGERRAALKLMGLSIAKFFFWNIFSTKMIYSSSDSMIPFLLKGSLVVGASTYSVFANFHLLDRPSSSRRDKPTASPAEIGQLQRHIDQLTRSLDPLASNWLAAARSRLKNLTG